MVCDMGILTEFSKVFTYKTPISVIKQIPNTPHLEYNKQQTQMNNAKTGTNPMNGKCGKNQNLRKFR